MTIEPRSSRYRRRQINHLATDGVLAKDSALLDLLALELRHDTGDIQQEATLGCVFRRCGEKHHGAVGLLEFFKEKKLVGQVPREPVGCVGQDSLVGPCPYLVAQARQRWPVEGCSGNSIVRELGDDLVPLAGGELAQLRHLRSQAVPLGLLLGGDTSVEGSSHLEPARRSSSNTL